MASTFRPSAAGRHDGGKEMLGAVAGIGREVFMLGPIAGEDLASVWAKLSAWRDGAVIKRVRP
jgi:hypothetical protein